jgi:hypothetical protein
MECKKEERFHPPPSKAFTEDVACLSTASMVSVV